MNKQALVTCVLAGVTGCVVNGKPMFGLGSSASSGGTGGSNPIASVSSAIAGRPAWCASVPDKDHTFTESIFDEQLSVDSTLPDLAFSLCHPDDDARDARGRLEARRQELMKAMEMTEEDWATEYAAWHALPFNQRNASHVPFTKAGLAWSKMGPIDQFAYVTETSASPYIVDAMKLTEVGRLGYLRACLKAEAPVDWAECQGDFEAFDRKKVAAELRADTSRPRADRMWVRFALAKLDREVAAHAARVKELVAHDATYGKMFALAKAARAQWPAIAAKSADSLALLASIEDGQVAGLRSAWDRCSDQPRAKILTGIGKLSSKQLDAAAGKEQITASTVMTVLLAQPEYHLAASAMLACATDEDAITYTASATLPPHVPLRGPRTAALMAIADARLQPARRDEHIEIHVKAPQLARALESTRAQPGAENRNARDIVASVEAKADVVIVRFPKRSEVQNQCMGWRKTDRLQSIENGRATYEIECVGRKDVTVNTTTRDVTVAKRYAAKLEPGRAVVITDQIPEAVYASATATRPLAVFGVVLP